MSVYPDDLHFKQKRMISIQKGELAGSIAIQVEIIIKDKKKTILIDEFVPV